MVLKNFLLIFLVIFLASSCNDSRQQDIKAILKYDRRFPLDSNIVLVNIGALSRSELAKEIDIISKYKPRVIGIDGIFKDLKDQISDSLLEHSFRKFDRLVLGGRLIYNSKKKYFDSLITSHDYFLSNTRIGYFTIGTSTELINENKVEMPRFFSVSEIIKNFKYQHFIVEIIRGFDSIKFEKFLKRKNQIEYINFEGGYYRFRKLDVNDIFHPTTDLSFLKDKIILMGFMGSTIGDSSKEDKFYSPLRSLNPDSREPDLFGVEFLARGVAMILSESYID